MSPPPRLQALLDSLGEKVKRKNERRPGEVTSLAPAEPSRAPQSPPEPPEAILAPLPPASASAGVSVALRPDPTNLPMPQRLLSAAQLAQDLTSPLADDLHPTVLTIYRTLVQVAVEVAKARGYSPNVSQVTYHVPAEVLASELGMNRTTLWRNLKLLAARGLVDHRPHKTTVDGQTRNDGTLWAIRLTPIKGKRARLCYDDLKHPWRDLEADIRTGRTAYNFVMQQSKDPGRVISKGITKLLLWTLPPQHHKTPLGMTVARTPQEIFDLPYAAKEERGELVDAVAAGICQHLGDDSVNFYRRLLWQLLRLHDRGQDYLAVVHDAIIRAGVDKREGFARKAGALLVSRLKQGGLWELLQSTPAYRVGVAPLAA